MEEPTEECKSTQMKKQLLTGLLEAFMLIFLLLVGTSIAVALAPGLCKSILPTYSTVDPITGNSIATHMGSDMVFIFGCISATFLLTRKKQGWLGPGIIGVLWAVIASSALASLALELKMDENLKAAIAGQAPTPIRVDKSTKVELYLYSLQPGYNRDTSRIFYISAAKAKEFGWTVPQ